MNIPVAAGSETHLIQHPAFAMPPEVHAAFSYLHYAQAARTGPVIVSGAMGEVQLPAQRELSVIEKRTLDGAHCVLCDYFNAFEPGALHRMIFQGPQPPQPPPPEPPEATYAYKPA